jgi:hypothetical protein
MGRLCLACHLCLRSGSAEPTVDRCERFNLPDRNAEQRPDTTNPSRGAFASEALLIMASSIGKRAQGMPGVWCTRSLACNKKARKQVTAGTPQQSGIPCTMVYRLIRALPGVPGLIATVATRNTCFTQLDPSVGGSGPHDFTVRSSSTRQPSRSVHRIPRPTFVTTRTPLFKKRGTSSP